MRAHPDTPASASCYPLTMIYLSYHHPAYSHLLIATCYLKWGRGVNETPVLARNTEHQALSQTCKIRTCMLRGSSRNSHAQSSLESSRLVPWKWEFLFVHCGDLRKLRHSRSTEWRNVQVNYCTSFKWNSKLTMRYRVRERYEIHPRPKLTPLYIVLN